MPKFYVESGTVRCIVSAENSQSAALWAVHRVMQQIMPLDETADRSPEDKGEQAREAGVMVLEQRFEPASVATATQNIANIRRSRS